MTRNNPPNDAEAAGSAASIANKALVDPDEILRLLQAIDNLPAPWLIRSRPLAEQTNVNRTANTVGEDPNKPYPLAHRVVEYGPAGPGLPPEMADIVLHYLEKLMTLRPARAERVASGGPRTQIPAGPESPGAA